MKIRSMLFIMLFALLTVACGEKAQSGLRRSALGPRFDVEGVDCNMSPDKCSVLLAGITYLRTHANSMCINLGNIALARYNSTSGDGYDEAAQVPNADMGVLMQTGTSLSGWVPQNGRTQVYPSFWPSATTDQLAGALIAHEEVHHLGNDGPNHNTTYAAQTQSACLNNQA